MMRINGIRDALHTGDCKCSRRESKTQDRSRIFHGMQVGVGKASLSRYKHGYGILRAVWTKTAGRSLIPSGGIAVNIRGAVSS